MTHHALTPEGAEAKARELLDARIASVRLLVKKAATVNERREALTHAKAEEADAWRAALKDGWTADELRRLGLSEPARPPRPRRPRKRSESAPPPDASESAEAG